MSAVNVSAEQHVLRARRIGIDTYQEPVVYMRDDCAVCRSEGFDAQSRVRIELEGRIVIATLDVVHGALIEDHEIGLSEIAWRRLRAEEGAAVQVSHPEPLDSFRHVRAKLYGHRLEPEQLEAVIGDIAVNRYSDVQLSAFVSACTLSRLDLEEIESLTRAMVDAGERLEWGYARVLDKHCVGGLPGNRTTPIVVSIVAACGVPIPKTSSRAITSPAGTADAMETLAPVDLGLDAMRRVVEQECGCIVWGGAVGLSPADDVLIRVERLLDVDSDAQLIASVLSKKVAAGATHVVIDMPVGPTAKVRDSATAARLADQLVDVGDRLGLEVAVETTEGLEPVGRGIGPALEARDVLSVLECEPGAPVDLRRRAARLAGRLLETADVAAAGQGRSRALEVIDTGAAWHKFQAICRAQGGMREPPSSSHTEVVTAARAGTVERIDNRRLARLAKLAGAPSAPAAGVEMAAHVGQRVTAGEPLYTVHAETAGELAYALKYLEGQRDLITLGEAS